MPAQPASCGRPQADRPTARLPAPHRPARADNSWTDSPKAVSLSQATITGILDRLEKRDLITRERDHDDRRRINISLTKQGSDLLIDAPIPLHQSFSKRLAELPEQEQEKVDTVLREIVEMMEAEDIEAAPMLSVGLMTAEEREVAALLSHDDPRDDEPSSSIPGDPLT
jgi:DNA-binding PadR family transcriptional regulator